MSAAFEHPSDRALLDWWLHDLAAADGEAVDEHLLHCDACGQRLDAWMALGDGVREAFRAGRVACILGEAFLQRLRGAGVRVREYAPPPHGSVACTVGPDDDLLVGRLRVPLQGVQRLDAQVLSSLAPGQSERLVDLPFDASKPELLFVPGTAAARAQPAHVLEVRLLAVEPGMDERELARYRFDHRPWGA